MDYRFRVRKAKPPRPAKTQRIALQQQRKFNILKSKWERLELKRMQSHHQAMLLKVVHESFEKDRTVKTNVA